MNWQRVGSRYLAKPYQILQSVRGFDVWVRDGKKYKELHKNVPYLEDAKRYAEDHASAVA